MNSSMTVNEAATTVDHNYMVVVRQPDSINGIPFMAKVDTITEARKEINKALDLLGAKPTMTMNNGWTVATLPAAAVLNQTHRYGRLQVAKSADGKLILDVINLNVKKAQVK